MRHVPQYLVLPLALGLAASLGGCAQPAAETVPTPVVSETEVVELTGETASITEVRDEIASGRSTVEQVVARYLAAIQEKEPVVNAVIEVVPTALDQARALDERIAAGEPVGQLAGVPFVVKDNMDVVGLPTTGGSIGLAANYPSATAPAVQRLLDEDAILIAKTNMSELAASFGRLGYSSKGGLTLNPVNLARNASGSSSGTAAAVAAGMAVFGLGTDTSGSVRGPASATGTVGVRPTYALVPRTGVVPLSLSFDTVGPITSNVEDQRILLDILAGPDPADEASGDVPAGYTAAGGGADAGSLRIGVVANFTGGDPEVDQVVDELADKLETAGATVVDIDLPAAFESAWGDVLGPVGDAEFAVQMDAYLEGAPSGVVGTVEELVALYESPGAAAAVYPVNPARLDGIKTTLEARSEYGGATYTEITGQTMPALREELVGIMDGQDLDALVFATMSCVASPRWDVEDPTFTCDADDPYAAGYIASATGLPEVTVPLGTDAEGLPVGVSFLGRPWAEATLLDAAEAAQGL
jgi:amidase